MSILLIGAGLGVAQALIDRDERAIVVDAINAEDTAHKMIPTLPVHPIPS